MKVHVAMCYRDWDWPGPRGTMTGTDHDLDSEVPGPGPGPAPYRLGVWDLSPGPGPGTVTNMYYVYICVYIECTASTISYTCMYAWACVKAIIAWFNNHITMIRSRLGSTRQYSRVLASTSHRVLEYRVLKLGEYRVSSTAKRRVLEYRVLPSTRFSTRFRVRVLVLVCNTSIVYIR
jgi:hypothetical protein